MEYEFAFRLVTDLPLTDNQIAHVRTTIALEIMEGVGHGILNTPEEDDNAPEVRLLNVEPASVSEMFHDGTSVMLDIPASKPSSYT